MDIALRLTTDRLAPGAALALAAGTPRILYVAGGALLVAGNGAAASLAANSAWHSIGGDFKAGSEGAHLLRFELLPATRAEGAATLTAKLPLPPPPHLLRCDRVEFPPGGVAYTHTHKGPGIRCLLAGRIRIETAGATHGYAPGEAWFESGPEPVFAAGSQTEITAFIRVMVLPRDFLGRSSITYVRAEDRDKPRRQRYQVFIDTPIEL